MMETIFLWLVLCIDGKACTDQQVYQLDPFAGPAAMSDCRGQSKKLRAQMTAGNVKKWRMACATVADFELRGIQ